MILITTTEDGAAEEVQKSASPPCYYNSWIVCVFTKIAAV